MAYWMQAADIEIRRVDGRVRVEMTGGMEHNQKCYIDLEPAEVNTKLLRPAAEAAWEIIKETAVPLLEAFTAIFKPEEDGDAATEDGE